VHRSDEFLLYAIIRTDLGLTPSQYAVQSAHAILDSWIGASHDARLAYRNNGHGSKIALGIGSEQELTDLTFQLKKHRIPCSMTVEGPPCPERLRDTPIGIGVGPVKRAEAAQFLSSLKLLK
jgi:peptidyl-tRNA hydrolase